MSRKFSPDRVCTDCFACLPAGDMLAEWKDTVCGDACRSVFKCSPQTQTPLKTKKNHKNALCLTWAASGWGSWTSQQNHTSLFSSSLIHFLPYLRRFWWWSCLAGWTDQWQCRAPTWNSMPYVISRRKPQTSFQMLFVILPNNSIYHCYLRL